MPTVENIVTDAAGDPVEGADVVVRLIASSSEATPAAGFVDAGDETVVAQVALVTDAAGAWSTNLVSNADIVPAGSYYLVTERPDSTPRRPAVKYRIEVPSGAGPHWVGDLLVDEPAAIDSSVATAHTLDTERHHLWARQFLSVG